MTGKLLCQLPVPDDPLKIAVADALAIETDAVLRFLNVLVANADGARIDSVQSYHAELDELCTAPTECEVVRGGTDALTGAAERADVVVMGVSSHRRLTDVLFGTLQDTVITSVDRTVILVHSPEPRSHTFLRAILKWFVYQRLFQQESDTIEYTES